MATRIHDQDALAHSDARNGGVVEFVYWSRPNANMAAKRLRGHGKVNEAPLYNLLMAKTYAVINNWNSH